MATELVAGTTIENSTPTESPKSLDFNALRNRYKYEKTLLAKYKRFASEFTKLSRITNLESIGLPISTTDNKVYTDYLDMLDDKWNQYRKAAAHSRKTLTKLSKLLRTLYLSTHEKKPKKNTFGQWIDVNISVPKNQNFVLCATRTSIYKGFFIKGKGWNGVYNEVVTHWMPLPKNPNE